MPEVSGYCPSCGRSVMPEAESEAEGHPLPTASAADVKEAVLGALAYFTIVPAIVLLAIPVLRAKPFVRFHASQSILFSAATAIIGVAVRVIFAILSFVPFIGILFAWLSVGLVFLAVVMLWAVLVVKASQGEIYELPWIGHFASRLTAPHAG